LCTDCNQAMYAAVKSKNATVADGTIGKAINSKCGANFTCESPHSPRDAGSDVCFSAGTIPSGIAGGDASATTSGAASGAASSGAASGSTSGAVSLFSSTTGTLGAAAAVVVGLVSGGLAVAL
jgi:hypothetical protein